MPNYTENYNLKKPLPNENYNIQDHNDNMDIIDTELKNLDEKIENIEVPVTSVNEKTGDVVLTADDVGAETPAGAQAKADAAETNAKNHANSLVGTLSNLLTTAKNNVVAAINEIFGKVEDVEGDLESHKADNAHVPYGSAEGTNAKTITLDPAPTGYSDGMALAFKNVTANTDAVTINVNGLGAKSVLKSNGSALSSGNLKANSIYTIRYNGSNFILQGEGGEYGNVTAPDVKSGVIFGTESGLQIGTNTDKQWAIGTIANFSVSGTIGQLIGTISNLNFAPKTVIFIYTAHMTTYIACATIDTNLSAFKCTDRRYGTASMYLENANDFKSNGFNYYANSDHSGSAPFSNIKYLAIA